MSVNKAKGDLEEVRETKPISKKMWIAPRLVSLDVAGTLSAKPSPVSPEATATFIFGTVS